MNRLIKNTGVGILALAICTTNVSALTKNETVYSKLNYDGTVKTTIVNEEILNNSKLEEISDYSELSNIINLKNNNELKIDNKYISWTAKGKDILYQGTINKELPIKVDVTYKLNGEVKKVEDIIGKKGNITIELKYTNLDIHYEYVNYTYTKLYTPFVVTMGTTLDSDTTSNIKVTNAKVVSNGSKNMIVGISTPGLYESLNIEELRNLDHITINYDTTNFELSTIYNVITPKILESSDLNVFDRMDVLYSKVDDLKTNMDKINEGSNTLKKGSNTIKTSLEEAIININSNNNDALTEEQINGITYQTVESIKQLFTDEYKNTIGLKAVYSVKQSDTYKQLDNGIKTLENNGITKELINVCSSKEIPSEYIAICSNNTEYITKYQTLNQMETLMTETAYQTAINTAYEAAINTATNVSTTLSPNVANTVKTEILRQTASSLEQLYNGISELDNGIISLNDGITKYNEQGITAIYNTVNGDIRYTTEKIKALKKLSDNYESYAGKLANDNGETKFILVIDSIKNNTEISTKKTNTKKETLIDRIKNLFK